MSERFLQIMGVSKHFGGRTALDGISFDLSRGEVVGLLGPNGAGKSTMMRIIAGILRPDSGQLLLDGISIFTKLPQWHRLLGVALDDPALFEYLTVREHLVLAGQLYNLSRANAVRRMEELAEFFTLQDDADMPVWAASHGTRKKLALALGIIHDPRVLLLDESLNGIDAVTVRDFRAVLKKMMMRGTSVIISSHMLDSVESMIDRCIILNHGRTVFDTSMDSIIPAGTGLEQIYMEKIVGTGGKTATLSWL
jgi:ABC-2 type transport system ATP-binding protein